MKSVVSESGASLWNTILWLASTASLAIGAPYVLFRALRHIKQSRNRDTLPGQVVVITGASSGIGESLAHAFYTSGCKVVLAARRLDELQRVRKDLLETHARVPTHPPVIVQLDLADLTTLPQKIADILAIHGHIDILVNNGGISVRADVMSSLIDVDLRVMQVNYFGSVALTKACLPSMVARRSGRIVYVSSLQGKFALPMRSAYTASKYALGAFADALRAEVAKDNVRVLVVCPGYVNTALSMNALTSTGGAYGQTDPTTGNGMSAEHVAADIVQAILDDKKDVMVAPWHLRLTPYLRLLLPEVYFWAMSRRAEKNAVHSRENDGTQEGQASRTPVE